MKPKRGRKLFSLNYLFASFFGALMIAGAFAYFNYKFSEYKFIDFEKWIFYKKKDIFTPKNEKYIVLVYSSNQTDPKTLLKKIKSDLPILAVDLYQKRKKEEKNVIYITSGMNTLLKFIQRFNIYEVPSVFIIKRSKKTLYKQDSGINTLE
ncbi:MAG: hypothetical protein GXO31_04810 [Epsilonproteobacteria bacterium]|nr:hypothetical protein [Campylobacterota bacterium]